ncbi:MAG: sensor histidine kinase [Velocimicrobium sp.]
MKEYNSLLQRQIKKANLNGMDHLDKELEKLLDLVNEAYFDFEEEKALLERSIDISSREYQESIEASHKLQLQLIQNEKMAGIGQLSAGIAHEINNPLGFIQSNIETLNNYMNRVQDAYQLNKRMIDDTDSFQLEELRQECQKVKKFIKANKLEYVFDNLSDIMTETLSGLTRINEIVNSLLGFSRQSLDAELVEYDMNKGIKDTVTIANNEIKYHAKLVEKLEDIPIITVYSGEINQVILNLIVNAAYAIKSKGKQGTITVHTYSDTDYVYCEISDDGVGIPEAITKKIFEPFFTTKPVGSGTGLGLSISYDIIVNKHHGQIMVDSTMGEGTTFIIKLPLTQTTNYER